MARDPQPPSAKRRRKISFVNLQSETPFLLPFLSLRLLINCVILISRLREWTVR